MVLKVIKALEKPAQFLGRRFAKYLYERQKNLDYLLAELVLQLLFVFGIVLYFLFNSADTNPMWMLEDLGFNTICFGN